MSRFERARSLGVGVVALTTLTLFLTLVNRTTTRVPRDCCCASPPSSERTSERSQLEGYFPDVPLVTEDGETVHFYKDCLEGKVVVINFIFTTCQSICPRATENLVEVQAKLGDRVGRDIFMYSITVDPENDTPAALKKFMTEHGVRPGWHFLTGKPADVRCVLEKLGSYEKKKMNHTGLVVYGNETTGKWLMIYSAAPPSDIAQAILSLPGGLGTHPSR